MDISTVTSQLPAILHHSICAISFERGSASPESSNYFINPTNVWRAFLWLKNNNHLYFDLDISEISNHLSNSDCSLLNNQDLSNTASSIEENSLIPIDYLLPERGSTGGVPVPSISIPRSLSNPVSIYDQQYGEESAFPWLFPHGKYGYTYDRPYKISPSMYFRYRLYNKNSSWRKDISYLLHAAASYDKIQLKSDIATYLRMNCGSELGHDNTPISAGYIRQRAHDPSFLQNSYMFMKNIRGTVAYFRNGLNNLLAMLRSLGPPTLFVTLTADDLHWPELGMLLEETSYFNATDRTNIFNSMRADPLLTATHFD